MRPRATAVILLCVMGMMMPALVSAARAAATDTLFLIHVKDEVPRAGPFAAGMTAGQLRAAAGAYAGASFDIAWIEGDAPAVPPDLSVTLKNADGRTMIEFLFEEGDYIPEKKLLVDDPGIAAMRIHDPRFKTASGLHAGMTVAQAAAVSDTGARLFVRDAPAAPAIAFDQLPCVYAVPDPQAWDEGHGETMDRLDTQYDAVIPLEQLPATEAVTLETLVLTCGP